MKKTLLALGILALGVVLFVLLSSMRQPPQRLERPYLGPLVKTIAAPAQNIQIVVDGQGTVRPDAQIDLVPQVSGVVVWKASDFAPGGAFAKGDLLFQIDPRDYELVVQQIEAVVAQSRYRLDLARQESEVARLEWEGLHPGGEEPSSLVLRLPQLRAAEAELQAARARLEESQLRLERTRLHAPFDGRLRSSRVDVGQHIVAGQPTAQLYSIEKAEIVVPVPDEDLAWFELPLPIAVAQPQAQPETRPAVYDPRAEQSHRSHLFSEQGAAAVVSGSFAGRRHQWSGRVVRTEGELDPQSRMVRLVIEVEDPYGGIGQGQPPLIVGMFVDVAIAGRQVEGVRVLPHAALHQGDRVWSVGADGVLHVRRAEVVRRMKDEVLVYLDLAADERIVVSQLSGVTDGMKVRLATTGEEAGS
jgi:RND family efflux transporter MFP subunit